MPKLFDAKLSGYIISQNRVLVSGCLASSIKNVILSILLPGCSHLCNQQETDNALRSHSLLPGIRPHLTLRPARACPGCVWHAFGERFGIVGLLLVSLVRGSADISGNKGAFNLHVSECSKLFACRLQNTLLADTEATYVFSIIFFNVAFRFIKIFVYSWVRSLSLWFKIQPLYLYEYKGKHWSP